MGGVADQPPGGGPGAEDSEPVERPSQEPMQVDSSRYLKTAGMIAMAIGSDGMPEMPSGDPPGPDEGLTDENLVCAGGQGRPPCEHYGAILVPADGEAKGFGEMRQIRRFCKRLSTATELFEITTSIYACTLRSPADDASERKIHNFEAEQKRIAQEHEETGGSLDF